MPGGLVGRALAAGYDFTLGFAERAGLSERRAAVLSEARGATLEVGAGTGLNLDRYPPAVTELVALEPADHMAAALRRRAGHRAEVVHASAEQMPFEDDRFDTVVATLVLCTVPDPAAALAEIRRVLRPGGAFLFLEHVRSPDPRVSRWQDRLERPWGVFAAGCHPNRDTERLLREAMDVQRLDRDPLPGAPVLIRPGISGRAAPRS